MARPLADIDEKQVEALASIGCSYAEMAHVCDCDPSTLTRRFAQAIKNGRVEMQMSLRRKQFTLAMEDKGNATMLIWLGKQHLGQSDKQELTGKDGGPLELQSYESLTDEQLRMAEQLVNSVAGETPESGGNQG